MSLRKRELFKSLVAFYWQPSSAKACDVIIWLVCWLNEKDLSEMADYLLATQSARKTFPEQQEK